jgi:hypothetical protein
LAHMFLWLPGHTDNIRLRPWTYTMDWSRLEYWGLPMLSYHTWGVVRAVRLLYIGFSSGLASQGRKANRAHDCGD